MGVFKIPKDGGSGSLRNFENMYENVGQKTVMLIVNAVVTSEVFVCCILGAFAKLRKATISFVVSIFACRSARPSAWNVVPWTDLHES
jgi:hypothetical protein